MIDFEAVRKEAFENLSQTNSVEKVLFPNSTSRASRNKQKELWKIIIEVPVYGETRDITLFLDIKSDFPLSIPEIFLSEEDFEFTKYIPHVDDRRNICLYDKENIKIDIERPSDIIRTCLQKASQIISDGLEKKNLLDFRDEVVAYWSNAYHKNDHIVGGYIGEGLEQLAEGRHQGAYLVQPYNNVNLFLGSGSTDSQKVLNFFKIRGHTIEAQDFFYLGKINNLSPPFYFNHKSLLEFLKGNFSQSWKEIKSYLNRSLSSKILVFSMSISNEILFFGFYLYEFKNNYTGWRPQSLNTIRIMSDVQPNNAVTRVDFKYFTKERVVRRTDGLTKQQPLKFLLAGLGSIGSNLLFYLNTLDISEVVLVDPEKLELENINRHLLSYHDVGQNKVDAIKKYIIYNNPFTAVDAYPTSIINLIQNDLKKINDMDVIFCAIGKDSVENYILQCLNNGEITKPVVLLWVEPYLLGAHVLYINPNSGFLLKNMEQSGYYVYNVINVESYEDSNLNLLLKEAGCQGSYIPYGKEAIATFFALFLPELFNLIKSRPSQNLAFTYIGNLSLAVQNNLKLSDFARASNSFQLCKHFI